VTEPQSKSPRVFRPRADRGSNNQEFPQEWKEDTTFTVLWDNDGVLVDTEGGIGSVHHERQPTDTYSKG